MGKITTDKLTDVRNTLNLSDLTEWTLLEPQVSIQFIQYQSLAMTTSFVKKPFADI